MLTIRRGAAADLPAVSAIQGASPEAAHWTAADYLLYDFRVAVRDSRVEGFLVARRLAADECELLNVAVAAGSRRSGVGRALVRDFLSSSPGAVFLEVRESNSTARKFYEIIGFREAGRRPEYYRFPSEAAIVMKFHSC
jgi:ribosomal-protein-alanine N-acetyltransferase